MARSRARDADASDSQVSSTRTSSTDGLTGLPDRPAFAGRVAIALTEATAGRSELAVLLLDLDHYRSLRNSLGPAAGDALLGAVAGRLSATLRHGDVLGRLAEDEFAVLLLGVTDAQDAAVAAARLLAVFERPFQVAARQVLVRVSIGVASGGFGTPAASELLRDAEMAMLRAKAEGGDRWASFAPGMHAASLARFDLEHALGEAIANDQLTLEFQPMIALAGANGRSGHIRRVEALVRWRHPQRGLIPPSDFIPLAEETGLIVELGAWVLRAAARQGRAWQQMAEQHVELGVSVNISPRQLFHPGLLREVGAVLETSGMAPGTLLLEITEHAVMRDPDAAVPTLTVLRDLGVGIALDDFGTGSSSLSHLTRLPLDALKIDRSFVAGLGHDGAEGAVVRTLVQLGRVLGLETIAEGVETRDQLVTLRGMGCDLAQGYLFGKPLGPEGITALLRSERRRSTSWAAAR